MGNHKKSNKTSSKIIHETEIEKQIQKEKEKEQLAHQKQYNRDIKFENFEKTLRSIFRIIVLIGLALILVGVFILIVWCIILYCKGNSKIATIVVTVIQLITGIVSLVVGVWALALTIQTNRENELIKLRGLNIRSSTANAGVKAIKEYDVNIESL